MNKDRQSVLLDLIQEHGVLNASQCCRLFNGYGKNEYRQCYYTFKEKPKGTKGLGCRNRELHKCQVDRRLILYSLMTIGPPVKSAKLRFWDHGGIGTDFFRFFWIQDRLFAKMILARKPN